MDVTRGGNSKKRWWHSGKLVSQIDIKSDADMFHQLWRDKPHQIPGICPDKIQKCDLHQGQWGTVGSVLLWHYTQEGKAYVTKDLIEAIDEEKKSVTFKVIEGELLKQYKTFKLKIHVDTIGEDNIVTLTLEYEKLKEDVPDPHAVLDLVHAITKDIETHHLNNPK